MFRFRVLPPDKTEEMEKNAVVCACLECGELIRDGDTAYEFRDGFRCPACVEAALVVCRAEPIRWKDIPGWERRAAVNYRKDEDD